jgi:hypothetical protein
MKEWVDVTLQVNSVDCELSTIGLGSHEQPLCPDGVSSTKGALPKFKRSVGDYSGYFIQ